MTATASTKKVHGICQGLVLRDQRVISSTPDRANITLTVQRRPYPVANLRTVEEIYDYVFHPLIEELLIKGSSFSKTVVYTKLKWCGYGHNLTLRPNLSGQQIPRQQVSQFHSTCTKEVSLLNLTTKLL